MRREKAKKERLEKDIAYLSRKVRQWESKEREIQRMEKKKRLDVERRRDEEDLKRRVRIEEFEREKARQKNVRLVKTLDMNVLMCNAKQCKIKQLQSDFTAIIALPQYASPDTR